MTKETTYPLAVVTVTFNSSTVLPRMLETIPSDVPVTIVDNGSGDADEIAVIAKRFGSHLVCNKENLGFGRACNIGASNVNAELVFFLNPDAVIVDRAIEHLIRASRDYPHASAFGPAIKTGIGRPYFRRSSVIAPIKWRLPRGWPDQDTEVPVLSGAALAVRKLDFDSVGGFDPKIFLYHEDDDLCLRLKELADR